MQKSMTTQSEFPAQCSGVSDAAGWSSDRAARLVQLRDLFDEAAADAELSPDKSQRENICRLLHAAFHICGTLRLPRGWVDEVRQAFEQVGCEPPCPKICRWYRSVVSDNPLMLEDWPWADPETIGDMLELCSD